MHDDELTDAQVEELGALLVAERPRPREGFAADLDERVAARFATARSTPAARSGRRRRPAFLQRPFLPAAAASLAVGLVALVVALSAGGGDPRLGGGATSLENRAAPTDSAGSGGGASSVAPEAAEQQRAAAQQDEAAPAGDVDADALAPSGAGALSTTPRKVERTASLELGTDPDRVDDVAQGVLGVVARYDAIVDRSSVSAGPGSGGGIAQFELRVPAARLQPALAALSRLPDAHVVARTDDTADVNQAYVSIRRRLANARAERAGVVRALANADTEDETLRLRARLDTLERTIAQAERAQRALDRRVDFSRVSVAVHGGAAGGTVPAADDGHFTIGDAAHDALRVLEVAAGVIVIAAAALTPVAILAALAWPLARTTRRRRREHALDAA